MERENADSQEGRGEVRGQAEPWKQERMTGASSPFPTHWHQLLSSTSFLSRPIRDDHMGQLSLDFQSHKFPHKEPHSLP